MERRGKDTKGSERASESIEYRRSHEVLKGVVRAERLKSPSDYIHEADSVTLSFPEVKIVRKIKN